MEENRNDHAFTYGDESRMYEEKGYDQQENSGQTYADQQDYNQSSYSGQAYYNQPFSQEYYNQPQHSAVKDIFALLLMVILPIRTILSMIMTNSMLSNLTYESLMDQSFLYELMDGSYVALSGMADLLFWASLAFFIVDIVMVRKGNYKIVGLILFAIFLNAGYFIWRAHILGRKKVVPILYTIAYVLLNVIYISYVFVKVFSVIMNIAYYM